MMEEERSAAAPGREYQTRIAVLLAAAAVTTALVGARTANLIGSAGGNWESAVREEVKQGAARTTGEILVYGATLPNVTSYQETKIRAEEYLAGVDSLDEIFALTSAELDALNDLHRIYDETAKPMENTFGEDDRYFAAGDRTAGFDLERKLADQRAADLSSFEDPSQIRAAGDDRSKRGIVAALAGVLAAVAFLLGSVANALVRGKLVAWWAGAAVLAVAIVGAVVLEVAPVA
jgi:hypothetical protein